MSGPRIEQIECPWCPCGDTFWRPICCGNQLAPARPSDAHMRFNFRSPQDAWRQLADHVLTVHGVSLPPSPPEEPAPGGTAEPLSLFGGAA